jgi:hypothetical protein
MKQLTQILFTIFFVVYLATVLQTEISLTGFWTDVIFSIYLSFVALRLTKKNNIDRIWLSITFKTTNLLCSFIVISFLVLKLIIPFGWDTYKLRSFYFQSVDGRLLMPILNLLVPMPVVMEIFG